MKRRLKILPSLTVILLAAALIAGCNIFGFTTDAEKSPVEKAEDEIRKGNYAEAKKELADAVKDSTDSMALYLNAKISLLDAGIDMAKIAELIEGQENIQSGDNLAILTIIDDMPDKEKTAWYTSNMEVRANISKIWNGETTGLLKKDDIALDFTVSNMMSGVLGLRDTNRDGVIDAGDFQIDLAFIQSIGTTQADGFNLDGAMLKDEQGDVTGEKLDGLTVFLGDWSGKIAGVSKSSAAANYKPDDINPLIAFVLSLLDDGSESLLFVLGDDTSFDVDDINNYIKEIANIINFYWYDDGIDNDGDGKIDEETINGIDDDGDGLVDEDSDYHPADPTKRENTEYIHIWQSWNNR